MTVELLSRLPGAKLIRRGLADLEQGVESAEALLVCVGAPRLRELGLSVPAAADGVDRPERALYRLLLAESGADAHTRYNALIRRLVSLERALAAAQRGG